MQIVVLLVLFAACVDLLPRMSGKFLGTAAQDSDVCQVHQDQMVLVQGQFLSHAANVFPVSAWTIAPYIVASFFFQAQLAAVPMFFSTCVIFSAPKQEREGPN
jgi:hypothetical protein